MTKDEIRKLNKIKRVLMKDIRDLAKDKKFRLGFKQGFNVCRRKIRKVLLPKLFKK